MIKRAKPSCKVLFQLSLMGWFWALLEGIRYYPCIVRGWWKRWPFLPVPPSKYVQFRLDTVYGMVEHGWPRPGFCRVVLDTRAFLLWRRKFRLQGKLSRSHVS